MWSTRVVLGCAAEMFVGSRRGGGSLVDDNIVLAGLRSSGGGLINHQPHGLLLLLQLLQLLMLAMLWSAKGLLLLALLVSL